MAGRHREQLLEVLHAKARSRSVLASLREEFTDIPLRFNIMYDTL
jgi:hypothetical protein